MEWITRIISYIFSFAAGYFFYKIECCFLTPKKGKLLFLDFIQIPAFSVKKTIAGDVPCALCDIATKRIQSRYDTSLFLCNMTKYAVQIWAVL